jgi:hypothetical protein
MPPSVESLLPEFTAPLKTVQELARTSLGDVGLGEVYVCGSFSGRLLRGQHHFLLRRHPHQILLRGHPAYQAFGPTSTAVNCSWDDTETWTTFTT